MPYRGVGECDMCGTVQKIVTSHPALCSACWKFRHGKAKSWHGTCRVCGARPVLFNALDPICDRCREEAEPIDLDSPEIQEQIQKMRGKATEDA